MAYIRYGERMPSGTASASFVIGGPDALMSFNTECKPIPYSELVGMFKTKEYQEIRRILQARLVLTDEENDIVCERLFEEHKAGEWDGVPEWSGKKTSESGFAG